MKTVRNPNSWLAMTVGLLILAASPVLGGSQKTLGQGETATNNAASRSEATSNGGSKGEVEAAQVTGALRYRVMISDFNDRSQYMLAGVTVTRAFEEYLANALQNDGRFVVIAGKEERVEARQEQVFAQESGWAQSGSTAPQKGKMSTAQLLVEGTITKVIDKSSGFGVNTGILPFDVRLKSEKAAIGVIIRIYDATTVQLIASREIDGKSSATGLGIFDLPGNTNVAFAKNKDLAKAMDNALRQAVDFCAEQLGKIEWRGNVVDAEDPSLIVVNRGEREGVTVGSKFAVGKATPKYDPESGELLFFRKQQVGTLRVVEVRDKVSFCEPVIKPEDKIDDTMAIWPAGS